MNSSFEVSATQVKTDGHIRLVTLETIVVEFDISIQHRVRVDSNLLRSLNHGQGTEVRQKRIIDLNVPAPDLVQVCDLLAICRGDVTEVPFFAVISIFSEWVISMTEMKLFRGALRSILHQSLSTIVILMYLTSSAGTFFAKSLKAST